MPVCHICNKSNLFSRKEIEIFRVRESLEDTNYCPHRICMKCLEKYEKKNNVRLTVLGYYAYKSKKFVKVSSPNQVVRLQSQVRLLQRKDQEQRRLLA